jgi:hypothetical protein
MAFIPPDRLGCGGSSPDQPGKIKCPQGCAALGSETRRATRLAIWRHTAGAGRLGRRFQASVEAAAEFVAREFAEWKKSAK